ncbi:hypothetical protein HWQ67_05245 [Candidatus Magnetobacterium casensis]|uniref:Phage protein Gp138 N-terminal domain-containing protein n=1 Tax=Candidatus Magnetobacterium casense TaxID=1455061 RepID=A0ABS6RWH7_9BACT|nr:hypothetical protein [Candidatus Magnetobacterium casensis]
MSWVREVSMMITRRVWEILRGVHTHLPAKVVSYDGATNTVSIQPCLMSRRADDPDNWTGIELPVVEDVPVQLLGSGKCLLAVAPQAGSYGTYHVSERCLEQWITKGGIVDPGSNRAFDLSDGFFIPGVYPTKTDGDNGKLQASVKTDRIELRTRAGTAYMAVLDDGTIEIASPAGDITINKTTGQVSINGNLTVDA